MADTETLDSRAAEICQLEEREESKISNFKTLWQETANLVFPRENQITDIQEPGIEKTRTVYDTTAIQDSQDMTSGLSSAFIPSGQQFFKHICKDKSIKNKESIKRYLSLLTEAVHEALFESNFMLQLNESLRSLIVFGTCNLYVQWDRKEKKLNFKDWDICFYKILENHLGLVDTVILKFPLSARQAYQKFGQRCGPSVLEAANDIKKAEDRFIYIHIVRPRMNINYNLSRTYNLNMPFESLYVCKKDKVICDEGGFLEFPFSVARWMKSSAEIWGRGQGTENIGAFRYMQQLKKDFVECGSKWNDPPREVLDHYTGKVKVTPGAINYVREKGTIRALEQTLMGSFPITKDMIEFQQEIIHRAFFKHIFFPIGHLKGDRRTQLEIISRLKEGLRLLGLPVIRTWAELFTPTIKRSTLELIRNGAVEYPPPELQGKGFGIEYMGELAMAFENQQTQGFQKWVALVGEMEAIFPGAKDNINSDKGIRRIGRSYGVNEEDIATEDEVAARRAARQKELDQQKALAVAQAASEAYQKTSGAAEKGSPAAELQGAMK